MSDIVHVIAVLETKPGNRAAVLAAFAELVDEVRAEKGCLKYIPSIDSGAGNAPYGPDTIVVIEEWASQGDLDAHGAAPHMAAFGQKVGDMIAARQIHIMTAA